MAGHSKFKNIQHRKNAQDKKRAKLFTRLVKEISVSVQEGGNDPNINYKLRNAIQNAKNYNVPKDKISKAIEHDESKNNLSRLFYTSFLNKGCSIIIETITDNKNRTVANIRNILSSKMNASLSINNNSVIFLFDHLISIIYQNDIGHYEDVFDYVLNCNIEEFYQCEDNYKFLTTIDNAQDSIRALEEKFGKPLNVEFEYIPKDVIMIEDVEHAEQLIHFLSALEDDKDVQNLFINFKFSKNLVDQYCDELDSLSIKNKLI